MRTSWVNVESVQMMIVLSTLTKSNKQDRHSAKYARYVPNYNIAAQEDVIPLVFETHAGYAPVTFEFLKRITSTIAVDDRS